MAHILRNKKIKRPMRPSCPDARAFGARRAHNFCVAAVLENILHHRNRTFSYPLASHVPMEMFANFYMERQGEYYGFLPADGQRIMSFYAVNDSLAVP